jgi:DNA-binding transcriptional MerR regulator
MLPDSKDIDLAELAAAAGVTHRTVRYYVQQGLLPSPGTRGPGTKYDRSLIDRLQLIKLLQRSHWPLAKIRSHLEGLDDESVRRELGQPPELPLPSVSGSALRYVRGILDPNRPSVTESRGPRIAHPSIEARAHDLFAAASAASPMAAEPPASVAETGSPPGEWQTTKSTWERVRLSRDVELNIRRPLTREQNKLIDRLLEAARNIFSEED